MEPLKGPKQNPGKDLIHLDIEKILDFEAELTQTQSALPVNEDIPNQNILTAKIDFDSEQDEEQNAFIDVNSKVIDSLLDNIDKSAKNGVKPTLKRSVSCIQPSNDTTDLQNRQRKRKACSIPIMKITSSGKKQKLPERIPTEGFNPDLEVGSTITNDMCHNVLQDTKFDNDLECSTLTMTSSLVSNDLSDIRVNRASDYNSKLIHIDEVGENIQEAELSASYYLCPSRAHLKNTLIHTAMGVLKSLKRDLSKTKRETFFHDSRGSRIAPTDMEKDVIPADHSDCDTEFDFPLLREDSETEDTPPMEDSTFRQQRGSLHSVRTTPESDEAFEPFLSGFKGDITSQSFTIKKSGDSIFPQIPCIESSLIPVSNTTETYLNNTNDFLDLNRICLDFLDTEPSETMDPEEKALSYKISHLHRALKRPPVETLSQQSSSLSPNQTSYQASATPSFITALLRQQPMGVDSHSRDRNHLKEAQNQSRAPHHTENSRLTRNVGSQCDLSSHSRRFITDDQRRQIDELPLKERLSMLRMNFKSRTPPVDTEGKKSSEKDLTNPPESSAKRIQITLPQLENVDVSASLRPVRTPVISQLSKELHALQESFQREHEQWLRLFFASKGVGLNAMKLEGAIKIIYQGSVLSLDMDSLDIKRNQENTHTQEIINFGNMQTGPCPEASMKLKSISQSHQTKDQGIQTVDRKPPRKIIFTQTDSIPLKHVETQTLRSQNFPDSHSENEVRNNSVKPDLSVEENSVTNLEPDLCGDIDQVCDVESDECEDGASPFRSSEYVEDSAANLNAKCLISNSKTVSTSDICRVGSNTVGAFQLMQQSLNNPDHNPPPPTRPIIKLPNASTASLNKTKKIKLQLIPSDKVLKLGNKACKLIPLKPAISLQTPQATSEKQLPSSSDRLNLRNVTQNSSVGFILNQSADYCLNSMWIANRNLERLKKCLPIPHYRGYKIALSEEEFATIRESFILNVSTKPFDFLNNTILFRIDKCDSNMIPFFRVANQLAAKCIDLVPQLIFYKGFLLDIVMDVYKNINPLTNQKKYLYLCGHCSLPCPRVSMLQHLILYHDIDSNSSRLMVYYTDLMPFLFSSVINLIEFYTTYLPKNYVHPIFIFFKYKSDLFPDVITFNSLRNVSMMPYYKLLTIPSSYGRSCDAILDIMKCCDDFGDVDLSELQSCKHLICDSNLREQFSQTMSRLCSEPLLKFCQSPNLSPHYADPASLVCIYRHFFSTDESRRRLVAQNDSLQVTCLSKIQEVHDSIEASKKFVNRQEPFNDTVACELHMMMLTLNDIVSEFESLL